MKVKLYPTKIQIKIIDNGIGIETKNLNYIFEPFVSIPTEYSVKGKGIGLYLCQIIVEKHNGTLNAYSEGLGKGATFTIELPRFHVNEINLLGDKSDS